MRSPWSSTSMSRRRQTPPRKFGNAADPLGGTITVNLADPGDVRVVLSQVDKGGRPAALHLEGPVVVGLEPAEARRFAAAVIEAADVIEGT